MGIITREQFLAQQEKKSAGTTFTEGPKVGYFKLEGDGDESVVRFIYDDADKIYGDILITHKTTIDGKFRRINCLRDYSDPISKCPMCADGDKPQQRLYIKLVEYTRGEGETIVATPKIWERPTSYVNTLLDKAEEYGDLSECIFKIRRHGKPGDMKTTYSIDLANPTIYNSSLYVKDFSGFDGYNVIGSAVLDKTFDEMAEMVGSGEQGTQSTGGSEPITTSAPRKVTY